MLRLPLDPPAPVEPSTLDNASRDLLLDALPELYALGDMTTFPQASLRVINRLLPVVFSTYNEIDTTSGMARCFYDPPEAEAAGEVFKPRLWKWQDQHPLLTRYKANLTDGVIKISDYLSTPEMHALEFYQEILAPQGVEDTLAFTLQREGNLKVFFAVNSAAPFTERDRAMAAAIQPHLVQAFENALVFTDAHALALISSHALSEVGEFGVLLTEPGGRILHANHRAGEHLSASFPGEGQEILPAALRRWLDRHEPDISQPLLPLEWHAGERSFGFRAARAANGYWFIATRENDTSKLASSLEQVYGLTRRQADTLLCLADGKSNADIAAVLGISERTVGKHLENLFDRLGVDNRKSAMRKAYDVLGLR